jgi:O-antigen ligase
MEKRVSLSTTSMSALLVLFAFSGMMKWMPLFPIDPTILFGGGLTMGVLLSASGGMPRLRPTIICVVALVSGFFVWYLFSSIYTVSRSFWEHKSLTLLLSVLSFIAPIMCFRTPGHFIAFNRMVAAIAFITAATVCGLYSFGAIDFLLVAEAREVTATPDYLVLGSLIGLGVIISVARPTYLNLGIAMLGAAALLILGGRGPLLFTALTIGLGFFLYWQRSDGMTQRAKYALLCLALGVGLFQWEGAELTLQRFTAMLEYEQDLRGGVRADEFVIAMNVISEAPLLGVGLGGYGTAGYGSDADIYPHNLFLEAFAEAGFFGFALFFASILAVLALGLCNRHRRTAALYFALAFFLLLNYSKSGGFVGARDLFMFLGVFLAYLNCQSRL